MIADRRVSVKSLDGKISIIGEKSKVDEVMEDLNKLCLSPR